MIRNFLGKPISLIKYIIKFATAIFRKIMVLYNKRSHRALWLDASTVTAQFLDKLDKKASKFIFEEKPKLPKQNRSWKISRRQVGKLERNIYLRHPSLIQSSTDAELLGKVVTRVAELQSIKSNHSSAQLGVLSGILTGIVVAVLVLFTQVVAPGVINNLGWAIPLVYIVAAVVVFIVMVPGSLKLQQHWLWEGRAIICRWRVSVLKDKEVFDADTRAANRDVPFSNTGALIGGLIGHHIDVKRSRSMSTGKE